MSRLVFSTHSYRYLGDALAACRNFAPGQWERALFPDGERSLRLTSSLKNQEVVLVGGTGNDADTLELYDMACGLVYAGVSILSLVIPYFGYSTQERMVQAGDVVTAKSRAVLLSSVPRARLTNEAILLDLHTPGISHYFEGHLQSVHLSALDIPLGVIRSAAAAGDVVVACTDAGRAKWVQNLANASGQKAAFVYKSRDARGRTEVTGVNAVVQDKHVIIYDDLLVRTGSSMIQAAAAYRKAGARKVTAVVTHGVLPGSSLDKIRQSGQLDQLHVSDSHPRVKELEESARGFLIVHPVVPTIEAWFSNGSRQTTLEERHRNK